MIHEQSVQEDDESSPFQPGDKVPSSACFLVMCTIAWIQLRASISLSLFFAGLEVAALVAGWDVQKEQVC